jgi:5'-deoxynucleotidase YfbR-like HD superfamily hydrolase
VIGDIISPFKAVLGGSYRDIEARLHAAVRLRFELPPNLPRALEQTIKKADQTAAYFEAVELAGFSEAEAARFFGRPGNICVEAISPFLTPWPAKRAETRYLAALRTAMQWTEVREARARPAAQPALPEAPQ